MADIHFEPWIGKDYENGGVFGKKILVLGESVYCGEQCSPCEGCDLFNIVCVETYVNNNVYDENGKFRKWTNTYNKFESSLYEMELHLNSFANLFIGSSLSISQAKTSPLSEAVII